MGALKAPNVLENLNIRPSSRKPLAAEPSGLHDAKYLKLKLRKFSNEILVPTTEGKIRTSKARYKAKLTPFFTAKIRNWQTLQNMEQIK